MTTAHGLDYLISRIAQANGDALLTDALTRLAVLSANRPDNQAKFDHFEQQFRLERGRFRRVTKVKNPGGVKEAAMLDPMLILVIALVGIVAVALTATVRYFWLRRKG